MQQEILFLDSLNEVEKNPQVINWKETMFQYLVPVLLKSTSLDSMKNHLHYRVVTTLSEKIKLTCVSTPVLGGERRVG